MQLITVGRSKIATLADNYNKLSGLSCAVASCHNYSNLWHNCWRLFLQFIISYTCMDRTLRDLNNQSDATSRKIKMESLASKGYCGLVYEIRNSLLFGCVDGRKFEWFKRTL